VTGAGAVSFPFSIRSAGPQDVDAYLAVMLRCWTGTVAPDSSAFREKPEQIASDILRGGGVLLRARDEVAGCGRFVPVPGPDSGRDWIELKRVGVVREYRGGVLGARIVETLETMARERGYRGAQIGVRADQPRLLAFWKELGYADADDVTLSNPNPLTPTPFFMRKLFSE
jgi:GNAT superfamily N-acetyltransferase